MHSSLFQGRKGKPEPVKVLFGCKSWLFNIYCLIVFSLDSPLVNIYVRWLRQNVCELDKTFAFVRIYQDVYLIVKDKSCIDPLMKTFSAYFPLNWSFFLKIKILLVWIDISADFL